MFENIPCHLSPCEDERLLFPQHFPVRDLNHDIERTYAVLLPDFFRDSVVQEHRKSVPSELVSRVFQI